MSIVCKCGYEHYDESKIIKRRDPITNQVRPVCKICGRRVFFKSVNPAQYKRMLRSIQT
ncbi:hypothetical protein JDF658_12200 [Carboxydocella sp. JDF658]|nr:hypothetical protein ULO1_22230 [Carboxydocella sp. ULO1]GAW31455.1 hypothetical protein JDF658_12200 [Carboxydocella sp. JDF658]